MEKLTLKSHRFRAEREADWRRLEALLDDLERGRGQRLSDDQVVALPVLYRAALSSLSTARAISLDQNLINYLESLCTRAYFWVYGTRISLAERMAQFFLRDWPQTVRGMWRETLVSLLLCVLGVAIAYFMVRNDPQWYYAFISQDLASGRDPTASAESLRQSLIHKGGASGLSFFSSFLFTHNAQVSFMAFALGFACGLPTAFLILTNGMMLGAMFAVYADHGLALDFGGWIFIHGVTELLAIVLAGAAGFRIGWALAFPGQLSRLDALTDAGRKAAIVMVGVVVMLALAGLLEGYGRQLISNTPIRYSIAAFTAICWLTYFYAPRRMR